MTQGRSIPPIPTLIEGSVDPRTLEDPGWSGALAAYLNAVTAWPAVARTTAQRLCDRLAAREPSSEPPPGTAGAVERLLAPLRAAADGLRDPGAPIALAGPADRVRVLVRWLAAELARASRSSGGALFTHAWRSAGEDPLPCPVGEEPLHLVPAACREELVRQFQRERVGRYPVAIRGDLCPACAERLAAALRAAAGDWTAAIQDVRVERLILDPAAGRGLLELSTPLEEGADPAAANRGILALSARAATSGTLSALRDPGAPWDLVTIVVADPAGGPVPAETAEAIRQAGAWIALDVPPV